MGVALFALFNQFEQGEIAGSVPEKLSKDAATAIKSLRALESKKKTPSKNDLDQARAALVKRQKDVNAKEAAAEARKQAEDAIMKRVNDHEQFLRAKQLYDEHSLK